MTDRTTKALLLAIALGLWANVAAEWLRPVTVHAQDLAYIESILRGIQIQLGSISADLSSISNDANSISGGICLKNRIC